MIGGGNEGGGSVGKADGGRYACGLPDGRTIPGGQEFNYEQQGVNYLCTCPHKPNGNKTQIRCRQDITGKLFVQIMKEQR